MRNHVIERPHEAATSSPLITPVTLIECRPPAGPCAGQGEDQLMAAANAARDTIPSPPPESGEYAIVRIEASPGAADHAPHYVESVLRELRHVLAGARCPAHDCAPSLTVNFGCEDAGTLDVVAHNCCSRLDDVVDVALRCSPVFRLILPR